MAGSRLSSAFFPKNNTALAIANTSMTHITIKRVLFVTTITRVLHFWLTSAKTVFSLCSGLLIVSS
jgi:hypothetical protein